MDEYRIAGRSNNGSLGPMCIKQAFESYVVARMTALLGFGNRPHQPLGFYDLYPVPVKTAISCSIRSFTEDKIIIWNILLLLLSFYYGMHLLRKC